MAGRDESRALLRCDYRDPLEVLIRQESRTCAGCVWVAVAFNAAYCGRGRQHGRRCVDYQEVERG
jgi:hypothetical protein